MYLHIFNRKFPLQQQESEPITNYIHQTWLTEKSFTVVWGSLPQIWTSKKMNIEILKCQETYSSNQIPKNVVLCYNILWLFFLKAFTRKELNEFPHSPTQPTANTAVMPLRSNSSGQEAFKEHFCPTKSI